MAKTITKNDLIKLLGTFNKVESMTSPRTDDAVRNQFKLKFDNGTMFQSYDTIIGARIGSQLFLSSSHQYSKTTSAYCTRWCGMNGREREAGINAGEIIKII